MHVPTKELLYFGMLALSAVSPAQAALTISSAPTANVTCAKATCTATAADAVLNVTRLQNMLVKENPKLVSGIVAGDIVIAAALTWPSTHTLTLDAYHSVTVSQPVTVTGTGGLSVLSNDGGSGGVFSLGTTGHVVFWDLSSNLTINGTQYTLVGDIASLASDISVNQNGYFALAANYNASVNGIYGNAPIGEFGGAIEGLGNTISNLAITNPKKQEMAGLFGQIDSSGTIENLALANAQIANGASGWTGALVGKNLGQITNISVSGSIIGKNNSYIGAIAGGNGGTIINSHASATVQGCCSVGGLVGGNQGTIRNSSATGNVTGSTAGGLVGVNDGTIDMSYATGSVRGKIIGGLAGDNYITITNCYATGHVTSGYATAMVGGLVGYDSAAVSDSYSAARVKGPYMTGGLIGDDTTSPGPVTATYWDFTTSGLTNSGFGAGNIPNIFGITALTTVQLQSGLPTGFDPSIWGENPSINGGLPYLLGNPPT